MRALPVPTRELVLRLCTGFILAGVAHPFEWVRLRMLTAQLVLVMSRMLGMRTVGVNFDTISLQGHLIQITVACTFIEVMLGIQPLIWRTEEKLVRNCIRAVLSAIVLYGCNILRIVAAQLLFGAGLSWTLAHDVPLGALYFAVWVAVWHMRTWEGLRHPAARLAAASN